MLELLFLLLPIAASYGWYMGYRNATQNSLKHSQPTGLKYQCEQQSFQNLTESLDINAQTIETHLALGTIFRQRGDAKNAIRIHQHISKQPNLSAKHYQTAQIALAKDFIEIGSYNRGEKLLLEVMQKEKDSIDAQQELLLCYQKMKDWQKGIELNETYQLAQYPRLQKPLANFLCELAQQNSCIQQKQQRTHQALQLAPDSARALYQLIDFYNQTKAFKQAQKSIRVFAVKHPHFIPELLPHAKVSFAQTTQAYESFLIQCLKQQPSTAIVCELAYVWQRETHHHKAEQILVELLQQEASLPAFERFIDIQLRRHSEKQQTQGLETLQKLVQQHSAMRMHYCCHHCGFKFEQLYWSCPACYQWESIYQPQIVMNKLAKPT